MSLETLLNDSTNSYLIYHPGVNQKILVSAPHHAPLGVQQLPCLTHRTSDENTGWIAYQLAYFLDCDLMIAGNYFLDGNKHKTSDYFKKIESLMPTTLIEIHGHGSGSANYDIEISSGSRDKSYLAEQLADYLRKAFSTHKHLKNYTIGGDFDRIHFRATKSLTINTDLWTAYHIELPQKIREDQNQYLSFCDITKDFFIQL